MPFSASDGSFQWFLLHMRTFLTFLAASCSCSRTSSPSRKSISSFAISILMYMNLFMGVGISVVVVPRLKKDAFQNLKMRLVGVNSILRPDRKLMAFAKLYPITDFWAAMSGHVPLKVSETVERPFAIWEVFSSYCIQLYLGTSSIRGVLGRTIGVSV